MKYDAAKFERLKNELESRRAAHDGVREAAQHAMAGFRGHLDITLRSTAYAVTVGWNPRESAKDQFARYSDEALRELGIYPATVAELIGMERSVAALAARAADLGAEIAPLAQLVGACEKWVAEGAPA